MLNSFINFSLWKYWKQFYCFCTGPRFKYIFLACLRHLLCLCLSMGCWELFIMPLPVYGDVIMVYIENLHSYVSNKTKHEHLNVILKSWSFQKLLCTYLKHKLPRTRFFNPNAILYLKIMIIIETHHIVITKTTLIQSLK